ncbi:MAG: sterol desaturase family protein [Pseudomonadales bacterium]|nr:sterol desaturase family protein [Pseudomonadales bacterium]
MYSENTLEAFRSRYRANINQWYNGYIHMLFVIVVGVSYIAFREQSIANWRSGEIFIFLVTIIVWNFTEYFVHSRLGHQKRKLAAMFYKRHTGDHHSFFSEKELVPKDHKDWRVTLFPAWLVIVTGIIASIVGWSVGLLIGEELGAVISVGLMVGYLGYEFCHFCDHLPQDHLLVKFPWIGHMRHLHSLHHRRDIMHQKNFSITFPLADLVFGTFYWEKPKR